MSYLVYARKYRPKNFDGVIGQNAVVRTLKNAIQNQRVAQAYIFSGMRGVGKTTVARILAKALNCQQGPTPDPCNDCDFCHEINEDRSVDVIEIDGASNTSVDDVRTLREGVQYKPIHCRTKVIIIDEIHMLSKSAFNALLKTLEEPPPNTVFIFATTEFHKVPATIVSRCQHFEFKRIPNPEIIRHLKHIAQLEGLSISEAGLHLIAEAADGSLRDAQSLLDQAVAFSGERVEEDELKEILGTISREVLFQVSSSIMEEQPDRIFPLVEKIIDSGYDLRAFHEELIRHFRDLLLVRSVKDPGELLPHAPDDLQRLRNEAAKAGSEDLLRYLLTLQSAEQGLKFSSHPRIYLEATLVKLCHYRKLTPLKELLAKVQEQANEQPSARRAPRPSEARAIVEPLQEPPSKRSARSPVSPQPKAEASPPPLKETVLEDPAVKNFMHTFKAQILSVERKKGEKVAAGPLKDLVE
jgi:DNA polymerase-3 subunit gamma/tau